jgi:putative endonuclease
MPFVYMLRCRDGSYYTGSTRDLERRLLQHQAGEGAAYTRRRLPVELVYAIEFEHVHEAYALEKRIQGWGRAKREALIEGRYDDLPNLAKKTNFARRPSVD